MNPNTSDNMPQSREIRVFLSSTFRDMEAERNHLLGTVFPEIALECRQRGVGFTEIDLRWGVTEEEVKNGRAVEICLQEIDRCREYPPFFLGLLGERYGWIPVHEELTHYWAEHQDSAYAQRIETALQHGVSVTELEMQYGILENPHNTDHARVFLRSAEFTAQLAQQLPESEHGAFFADPTQQQDKLKDTLREKQLIALDGYNSVEELGAAIKAFMLAQIEHLYPKAQAPTRAEQRNNDHAFYAASRRKAYVPLLATRSKVLDFIAQSSADRQAPRCLLIQGASGRGKTAFIADVQLELAKQQTTWQHAHYMGADGDLSLNGWLDRLSAALQASGKLIQPLPEKIQERWEALPTALLEVHAGLDQPMVLLLDAFDQCNEPDAADRLRTLIASLPPQVCLLITVTPDKKPDLPQAQTLELPALEAEQRKAAIEAFYANYGKKLSDDTLNSLVHSERCAEPLFLRLILEELRLHARRESPNSQNLSQTQIQTLLQCADAGALFSHALQEMNGDFANVRHPELANHAAHLLAASYRGLHKNDLALLLGSEGDPIDPVSQKPRLPDATLGPLLARLDPYCLRNAGRSTIMHAILRNTLLGQAQTPQIRHEIIAHFSSDESEALCERIYQRMALGDETALADELTLPNTLSARENDDELLRAALSQLKAGEAQATPAIQRMMQHWQEAFAVADALDSRAISRMNQLSVRLSELAFQNLNLSLLEALVAWLENHGADIEDEVRAISLNNLAGLYFEQNCLSEAEPLFLDALNISRKALPAGHPDIASSLNNLAGLYQAQNRLPEAEPLYLEALDIRHKALRAGHPDIATSLNNLAWLYKAQNRLPEAEPLLLYALDIYRKALPAGHPDIARSLNNLALLYQAQIRLPEAELLCLDALDIRRKALPAGHPDIATSLNNLAPLYQAQNRLWEAEPLYLEALDIRRKALPAGHPDIASSLNNLAALYQAQNRLPEAEPLYLEALDISRKALPAGHPDIATSLNNLAMLYHAQNRLPEAEPLLRDALDIYRKALPVGHPDIATSLNNLALLYQAQNHLWEAEPLYLEALDISRKALPAGHPDIATSLNNLADLYKAQNRLPEAEPLYLDALDIRRKALPAGHPDVATSLNNLAALYHAQNRLPEAEPLLRDALDIYRKALPVGHPDIVTGLNNLAALYFKQEKYAEALPLAEQALAIREQALGGEHPQTLELKEIIPVIRKRLAEQQSKSS